MRAFHIALLSLAASTAAPVFAAPIPYLNARSDVLSARGSNDSCIENKSQPENLTAMQLSKLPATTFSKSPDYTISTRDSMTDSMTAVAKMNAREPDVVERNVPRDVTHGSLAARATRKEMLAALLSDRSESSGQGIQARGFFSDLFDIGTTIMTDAAEDLIRDVSPDELHPRGDSKDVVEMPNTRRDAVDKFINAYMSKHATRESRSEKETQARGTADDHTKNLARGSRDAFIKALLKARESSRARL